VDTPGFNDTTRSNMEIMSSLASWIQTNDCTMVGVVYLHRITDRRFTGSSRMSLNILMAMCGERFFPHIVLASSMWNRLPSDGAVAEAVAREQELFDSFWGDMLRKCAMPMRYMGSLESGQAIIKAVLATHNAPPMSLEIELQDRCIQETAAGRFITAEIRRREEALRQELSKEEEVELKMKAELVHEQGMVKREGLLRRERTLVNGRRLEVRPTGNAREMVEIAWELIHTSWNMILNYKSQLFREQR
jgi:hypothetical protein